MTYSDKLSKPKPFGISGSRNFASFFVAEVPLRRHPRGATLAAPPLRRHQQNQGQEEQLCLRAWLSFVRPFYLRAF